MKRLLILILVSVLAPAIALADPHHVLVLRREGGGDAALHAKVDAAVLKLAKNIEGNVEMGEITLTDAAAATGCTLTEATCKDEVLATLGVDEMMLRRHGAVYPPVAAAMAEGVRARLGATYGVATTGVAGPEPSDGQPVGTAHIAVSVADDTVVRTIALTGDRHQIRRLTVEHALGLLLGRLREETY